jgi:hypothetical protein
MGATHVKKFSKFFLEMTPLGVKYARNPNLTFSKKKNASDPGKACVFKLI